MLNFTVERNVGDTKVYVRHIESADSPEVYTTTRTLAVDISYDDIVADVDAHLAGQSRTGFRVASGARRPQSLRIAPSEDGASVTCTGSLADMAAYDNSSAGVVRQSRPAIEQTVTDGSYGSCRSSGTPMYHFGIAPRATAVFEFKTATTSRRLFCGLASSSLGNVMAASDDPAQSYVGVQWSTSRGDTNLQFIYRKDSGSSQVISASSVTPAADTPYAVRVKRPSADTALIEILDASNVDRPILLDSLEVIDSSDLPADDDSCGWVYCWKADGADAIMTFISGELEREID